MALLRRIFNGIRNGIHILIASRAVRVGFFCLIAAAPLIDKHILDHRSDKLKSLKILQGEIIVANIQLVENIQKTLHVLKDNHVDLNLTKDSTPTEEQINKTMYPYKYLALPSSEKIEEMALELKKNNSQIIHHLEEDFKEDINSIIKRVDMGSREFMKIHVRDYNFYLRELDDFIREEKVHIETRMNENHKAKKYWEENFGDYENSAEMNMVAKAKENLEAAERFQNFVSKRMPVIVGDIVLSRDLQELTANKIEEFNPGFLITLLTYMTTILGIVGAILSLRNEAN